MGNSNINVDTEGTPHIDNEKQESHEDRGEAGENCLLKVNVVMMDGTERYIHVDDRFDDPVYHVMMFCIENKIDDIALLEIIKRRVAREIMRVKGTYKTQGGPLFSGGGSGGGALKSSKEVLSTGLSSTLKALLLKNKDDRSGLKKEMKISLPKSTSYSHHNTFDGQKSSKSNTQTQVVQHSIYENTDSSFSGAGRVPRDILENRKKSLQVMSNKRDFGSPSRKKDTNHLVSLNRSHADMKSTTQLDSRSNNNSQYSSPFHTNTSPNPHTRNLYREIESTMASAEEKTKRQASREGEEGEKEHIVSYRMADLKKKQESASIDSGGPSRDVVRPQKQPGEDRKEEETVAVLRKIFELLGSKENSGYISSDTMQLDTLSRTSQDLMDGLIDVIGYILETDTGIDFNRFIEIVQSKCRVDRLVQVG